MAARRPSASPQRRAAVEEQVARAARRLLAQGISFSDITMQQIADEAGIARSTTYLYFKEKSALLMHLAGNISDDSFAIMSRWNPQEPGALDRLTAALLKVIRHYRANADIFAAINEVAGYDRAVREYWDAALNKFIGLSEEVMRGEQRAGRARANLDALTAAKVVIYGGSRVIADVVANGDPHRDRVVAAELAAQQWFGAIRAPGKRH